LPGDPISDSQAKHGENQADDEERFSQGHGCPSLQLPLPA
jgi:hypothetical protein